MEKSFDRGKKMKKLLTGIAACVMAGAVCQGNSEQQVSALPLFNSISLEQADMNMDGVINLADLGVLSQTVTGSAESGRGDVNRDGDVNAYDMFLLRCCIGQYDIPERLISYAADQTADLGNYNVEYGSGELQIFPVIGNSSEWSSIVCGTFEIDRNNKFEILKILSVGSDDTWFNYDQNTGKVLFYCDDPSSMCRLNMTLIYSAYFEGPGSLGIKNGECFDINGKRMPLNFTGGSITVNKNEETSTLKIVGEPSDITETAGNYARFTALTSGTGLKYQWYWRKPNTTEWKACAGEGYDTDTLVVKAADARNRYQYYCEVTDKAGNKVSSRTVNLSVIPAVSVIREPEDCTAELYSFAEFHAAVSSVDVSYQWYWRKPNTTGWKACTGTGYNTDTLVVEATEARNGYQYYCEITDAAGNKASSRTVKLNVISAVFIIREPEDCNVKLNSYADFNITASKTNVSYQWYWRKPNTTEWKACAGEGYNKDTLVVEATQARNGYQYYCEVSDSAGNKVSSRTVSLNVYKDSIPDNDRYNYTVKGGDTAEIAARSPVNGISYQWYWRKPGTTVWKACTGTGCDTAVLEVLGEKKRDGYQYYCEISDAYGCSVKTVPVTLTVKAKTGED